MLIDTHCHLNMDKLKDKIPEILENCAKYQVKYLNNICTSLHEFEEIWQTTQIYKEVFCSVGIHPDAAHLEKTSFEELYALTQRDKVIAIGETGLDYYHSQDHKISQRENFLTHIKTSQSSHLPLVIHTREAEEDTIDILRREKEYADFSGVIHCFTGSQNLAEKMLDLGLYISFSGIITFKNAEYLRDIVKYVPLDRIIIETDSPFLAPVPHRGKANEPCFVHYVAQTIAEVKSLPYEEIAKVTSLNSLNLFEKLRKTLNNPANNSLN